jgi:ATP-binding protein involved in chromosome partitioning
MSISEQQLTTALGDVVDPHSGQTLAAQKSIRSLKLTGSEAAVDVELRYPAATWHGELTTALQQAASKLDIGLKLTTNITTQIKSHAVQRGLKPLAGVKNIVAIASGKGGVGKSTTAVNLALALVREGARVGLLDADIYGPSVPLMTGTRGTPDSTDGKTMLPHRAHGLQVNSIGYLVSDDQAMIWRGPMASGALDQLLNLTQWDDLDYLLVDMPPGTGDIQLSLAQKAPLAGAVIVTTPQDIALIDAKKGIRMFEKVQVPILGIVENMAVYCCPNCGHEEHIFGADGGKAMAEQLNMRYLGGMPLAKQIRLQTDSGTPTVAAEPQGEWAKRYGALARNVAAAVALQAADHSAKFPTIVIAKDK